MPAPQSFPFFKRLIDLAPPGAADVAAELSALLRQQGVYLFERLAAERRRLAAAVDQRRRTSQDRENVNNVTGRVAVEQQDAMLRAIDRPVEPVRATRAVTPSAPLLPAAAVARVASEAPVMAPARVPSVTRHLWPEPPAASLPEAEVIATRAVPGVVAQAELIWPDAPTELPTASAEGYSAQWTEA